MAFDMGLATIGAGAIGALGNLWGANKSAEAAAASTKAQLAWEREKFDKETELANTAHQREIADLEAAGLNKILSVGNPGAAVPTAGSISPGTADYSGYGRAAESMAAGINTAMDIDIKRKQLAAYINKTNAEIEVDNSIKAKNNAEEKSIIADMAEGGTKEEAIKASQQNRKESEARIAQYKIQNALTEAETILKRKQAETERTMQELNKRYSHESIVRAHKAAEETATEIVNRQIQEMHLNNLPSSMTMEKITGYAKGIATVAFTGLMLKGIFTKQAGAGIVKKTLQTAMGKKNLMLVDQYGQILKEY